MKVITLVLIVNCVLAVSGLSYNRRFCRTLRRSHPGCPKGFYCRRINAGQFVLREINECAIWCHDCVASQDCINTRGSYRCEAKHADNCPLSPPPTKCTKLDKYRTIDGSCNNLYHTEWGQALQSLQRILPSQYSDGLGGVRKSSLVGNTELPNPRLITTKMFAKPRQQKLSNKFTHMQMLWGQFIDHDMSHTSMMTQTADECNCSSTSPECLSINIPESDSAYNDTQCMTLRRSIHLSPGQCGKPQREQINRITSYIDGSLVYGSDAIRAAVIRRFKSGELLTDENGYLPIDANPHTSGIECNLAHQQKQTYTKCYIAGDNRVNVWVGLTAIHLVFVREHNRIARTLLPLIRDKYPHMNNDSLDEKVYQMARKIVGAELQVITYKEYLPRTIGWNAMKEYKLNIGNKYKYDSNLNAQVINAFSTAAFRFGHAEIPSATTPKDANFMNTTAPIRFEEMFFRPDLFNNVGQDSLMCGIIAEPSLSTKSDSLFSNQMRDKLFTRSFNNKTRDLPAINIQRGRDHGLPSYTAYREICGLSKPVNFEELSDHDSDKQQELKELYSHVSDIDLYVGAITENVLEGGQVGPTFACIIAKQFQHLKFGDRFWFQHGGPQSFTLQQRAALKTVTLSRVLCDNHQLESIATDVFHFDCPIVQCQELPQLDLELFIDM